VADKPTVVKTVRMIEVVKMIGRVMKTESVKMLEGPMMVGGQKVAKEEGVAVTGEVVAVTGEEVEVVVVVMEMMGAVVVVVVKEAKVVEEEENQEVMVENPLVVGETRWNCLEQVLWYNLSSDVVNPFQMNHS
jgi:hypothetical protein